MYDLKLTLARAPLVLRARAPRSCSALVLGEERKEEARSPMGTGGDFDVDESLSSPPRIERSTGPLTEPNQTVMPVSQCSHCTAVTQLVVHAQNGDGTGIGELAVL